MKRVAPIGAMMCSAVVAAFLAGIYTGHYETFPYPSIREAASTLRVLIEPQEASETEYFGNRIEPTAIPASHAQKTRWTILDTSTSRLPIIANGGLNQYLEHCHEDGCLAVTFDSNGNITETWPYRPTEIFSLDITGNAYPHELSGFEPRVDVSPMSVRRYGNGDLLVNFWSRGGGIFPPGMGIARVMPNGMPRWTRFDYSHHWSTLGTDGTAYVPSLRVGDGSLSFTQGSEPSPRHHTLKCNSGRPRLDIVQVVDGAGAVVEEIDLVPIVLRSNWSGLLPETTDFCDPLHLNYVDVVGVDAGPELAAGDLVLSLRNLSRFVILDPTQREIRRVVSGGFVQQHSVHHLSGSKFLLFDNRGGDILGPASRVVELNLATGVERRVFPNSDTPDAYAQVFSSTSGYLDISPDRKRVLASFTHAGRAFEIDIESGRLLAVFDNIHDTSSVPDVPADEQMWAGRFSIYGMSYVKD